MMRISDPLQNIVIGVWRVWLTGWSESQTRHAELYCELFSHRFRESSAAAGLVVTAVRGGVVSRSEADVNSSSSSGGAVTDCCRPLTPSTARVVLTREETAAGGDQPANSVTQGNIPLTVAGSYKPKRKYTFINRKPAAKPRNRGNRPVMSPQASQINHIVPGTPVSLCTPNYLCWWVTLLSTFGSEPNMASYSASNSSLMQDRRFLHNRVCL